RAVAVADVERRLAGGDSREPDELPRRNGRPRFHRREERPSLPLRRLELTEGIHLRHRALLATSERTDDIPGGRGTVCSSAQRRDAPDCSGLAGLGCCCIRWKRSTALPGVTLIPKPFHSRRG